MIMQQLLGHVELILEANFIYLVVSLLVSGNTRLSFDRMDHTIHGGTKMKDSQNRTISVRALLERRCFQSSLRQVNLAEGAVN